MKLIRYDFQLTFNHIDKRRSMIHFYGLSIRPTQLDKLDE